MQEWIIAMLVISVLLIIRDMAKTFLSGKIRAIREAAAAEADEIRPLKEKGEKYAKSFQKLAETFYGMPYRRDCFSQAQIGVILNTACTQVCANCYQQELCWKQQYERMDREAEELIRMLESGTDEEICMAKSRWTGRCQRSAMFLAAVEDSFRKEKETLIWTNRLIENRLAVAGQLMETSDLIRMVAEETGELTPAAPAFRKDLKRSLRKRHVLLKKAWLAQTDTGRRRMFLSLRTRNGQCVSAGEVARLLSEECGTLMAPGSGGRSIVNGEYHTLPFVEDCTYQVTYGVSRMTREGEKVSGDSYAFCPGEDRFVICLSDGMGSGREASQESEQVVELLEQFLNAGFSLETTARMVNSTLILKGQDAMFSTMDLCSVDLHTGLCSFLKAGAAATFVRRDHWVETISSENLALGLMQQMDFEKTTRKLYHGDYLFLVSDGVLDAFPARQEEELLREIILNIPERTPAEMGREVLERVLGYCDYHARDDMTVLIAEIMRK